jgi:hypothetical protein
MVQFKNFPAVNRLIGQVISTLISEPSPNLPFQGINERPARNQLRTKVKLLSVI